MDKNTHSVIEYAAISRLIEGNIEIETLIDKTNEPN